MDVDVDAYVAGLHTSCGILIDLLIYSFLYIVLRIRCTGLKGKGLEVGWDGMRLGNGFCTRLSEQSVCLCIRVWARTRYRVPKHVFSFIHTENTCRIV